MAVGEEKIGFEHVLAAHLSLVLEHGGNEDEAIAGLLHDVIEDCGVTAEGLRERFGTVVATIVLGCTDSEPGQDRSPATWLPRKLKYVEHLAHADAPVRLVSFCDKLHNARAILADYAVHGDGLWDRFNAGKDAQLDYYRALARAAKGRVPDRLSGALNAVVTEIADRAAGRGSHRE